MFKFAMEPNMIHLRKTLSIVLCGNSSSFDPTQLNFLGLQENATLIVLTIGSSMLGLPNPLRPKTLLSP